MHTKEIEFSLSLFHGLLNAQRHELLPYMSLLTFLEIKERDQGNTGVGWRLSALLKGTLVDLKGSKH